MARRGEAEPFHLTGLLQTKTDLDAKSRGLLRFLLCKINAVKSIPGIYQVHKGDGGGGCSFLLKMARTS